MILFRILDHDLHRSKKDDAHPLMIEIPALPEFVPAVVSGSRGQFLVSKKLTNDGKIRVGIFSRNSEKMDGLITEMFSVAFELSNSNEWPNVMTGKASVKRAFNYISGQFDGQPHVCLVPESWSTTRVRKVFGCKNLSSNDFKYRDYCRLVYAKVSFPIFLSRPDMVGMYTQFLGDKSAIVLHNVKRGISFCPDFGDKN